MHNMKKTKIIATLGPVTETKSQIQKLISAGVNVFRFNLKHNNHEWHHKLLMIVRETAKEMNVEVGTIADLQGPELRIGTFTTEKMTFEQNQEVYLAPEVIPNKICIPFKDINLIYDLNKGQKIFIDDGKVELEFTSQTDKYIKTIVTEGGTIGSRKSVSIPGADIRVDTLMPKDKADVDFAIANHMDFIALSFVRDAYDITTLRKLIKAKKGNQQIISKIETLKAIQNLKEILAASDVIMVARGDLGVEIPFEKVPKLQEVMIQECKTAYKPVIVATQMLMSMMKNPLPSRAEVSDIANAVFQQTDCLMLSDETTIGEHAVKAVQTMSKIARFNENQQENLINVSNFDSNTFEELLIAASVKLSLEKPKNEKTQIKGYIVFTESGKSARVLSRFRSTLPIFAFTEHETIARQLTMSYGVTPFVMNLHKKPVTNIYNAIELLKTKRMIEKADCLVAVFGDNVGEPGANNTISLVSA